MKLESRIHIFKDNIDFCSINKELFDIIGEKEVNDILLKNLEDSSFNKILNEELYIDSKNEFFDYLIIFDYLIEHSIIEENLKICLNDICKFYFPKENNCELMINKINENKIEYLNFVLNTKLGNFGGNKNKSFAIKKQKKIGVLK